MNNKELTLQALETVRGDDLHRARAAFAHLSDQQMDQEYGVSGKTCREILAGYEEREKAVRDATAWVEAL
mgnify:CR=1 FL=1